MLDAARKKSSISLNIMGKTPTGMKAVAKMPPKKASNTGTEHVWRSPRTHKTTRQLDIISAGGHKRGSGPESRGGKAPLHHTSPSSSNSSSDKESESGKGSEYCHDLVGRRKTMTVSQEELLDVLREKERKIKKLQTELSLMKSKSKPNKKTL